MSSNAESESGEEEQSNSGSNSPKHDKPPGFSFSKSAIADLPSTAVQSIHIENEEPVEMDDDAFVWKDVTPSGTKLAGKAKFKKQDWAKGKQQAAVKHAPAKVPTAAAAVKANPAAHHQTAVKQTAVPAGHHTAAAVPPTAVTANSLARMESKNRAAQMVKERPSQGKGATTAAAVPKRAPSGPKVAAGESATRLQQQQGKQTGSQTKVGGGKNARREQPHHGKQAQHK